MSIDSDVLVAQERLRRKLDTAYSQAKAEVRRLFVLQVVPMEIRDRDHFYKVVNWCNKNIGKGSQYWTVEGRVLRFVDPAKKAYNPPAKKNWLIKVPFIDVSPLLKM
jgi:hypothetical protein